MFWIAYVVIEMLRENNHIKLGVDATSNTVCLAAGKNGNITQGVSLIRNACLSCDMSAGLGPMAGYCTP